MYQLLQTNMKQKATVQGRSMVFNIAFVVLNILGLAAVVIGSQKAFKDYFLLLNFLGYVLMAVSAAGLFIFRGRLMMANIARGFVGALFIVSGLVKANDPIGFAYKLEEYFEDGALAYRIKELFGAPEFSLEWLIPYALGISIAICVIEILLGVLMIIGGKIKWVAHFSLLMMVFFTFLTWHTASCNPSKRYKDYDRYEFGTVASQKMKEAKTNKNIRVVSMDSKEVLIEEWKTPQCVSDCGCFGDAMKGSVGRSLTPVESLWKDIILLYLVVWIFLGQWLIEPNTKTQNVKYLLSSLVILALLSFVFDWYFIVGFGMFLIIGALWIVRAGGYFLGNYFGSSSIVLTSCIVFVSYVLMYEPMKDYRPFAEGNNLAWQMNNGFEGKFKNTHLLRNRRTGEIESYTENQYATNSDLWDEKQYKYVKLTQEELIPSRLPSITKGQFNPYLKVKDLTPAEKELEMVKKMLEKEPEIEEVNIQKAILKEKRIVILTSLNLADANWKNSAAIKSIATACKKDRIPFILLTSGSRSKINAFREKYQFKVPVFLNDEIGLKAIARSNPSMMILEKGIVKGKFPHRSIPTYEWLKKNTFKK